MKLKNHLKVVIWFLLLAAWVEEPVLELLEELQGLLEYGSEAMIKHTLLNFQSLTLSHFEYEEKWIFPLLRKALRDRARLPGNAEGLAVAAGRGSR